MFDQPKRIHFDLPGWLTDYAATYEISDRLSDRMKFVIGASLKNVVMGSGGPFAAAIFEIGSAKLVSLGVNLVTSQNLSILHAEMVAISLAQRKYRNFDLGSDGIPALELLSSAEPCSMCLGAIPWSGVKHIATAAREEDVHSLGFDEGPKPADWIAALQQRGIKVDADVEREQAQAVYRHILSELSFTKY